MSSVAQYGPVTDVKPAFTVTPETRDVVKNFAKFDRELHKSVVTQKTVKIAGFRVRCMRGHEIFVDSAEELKRLGFTGKIPLIGKIGNSDEEEHIGSLPPVELPASKKD